METKQMIEVMQAFEDGKKIEGRSSATGGWEHVTDPTWDWNHCVYRIAPEPEPVKEGRWERAEIIIIGSEYRLKTAHNDWFSIWALPCIPGFGGIDYRSPFDPKVIVRSMVPVMFSPDPNSDLHFSVGIEEDDRPGIPVAAWFWRE